MEPKENEIADAVTKILKRHMPDNGTYYFEDRILWGSIWAEVQQAAHKIISE